MDTQRVEITLYVSILVNVVQCLFAKQYQSSQIGTERTWQLPLRTILLYQRMLGERVAQVVDDELILSDLLWVVV